MKQQFSSWFVDDAVLQGAVRHGAGAHPVPHRAGARTACNMRLTCAAAKPPRPTAVEPDRATLLCHSTTNHIRPADGGLYVCTPVDPLLVVLPLLERARGAGQREGGEGIFCDPEQILQVGRLHECMQLQPCRWYGMPA